jgi:tetratricopeptide (TPR) repeat protein
MSSTDEKEPLSDEVCASCGIAAIDNITLKKCACNLVKYCCVDCQKNHRPRHEEECMKRKAELHDKELFTQPESSYLGECPICCLPVPLDPAKSTLTSCCCKTICNGCAYANMKREREQGLEPRCVYCREPLPKSQKEYNKRVMNRIKKNDPVAMTAMGKRSKEEGDYGKAFEYYTKAVELGDVDAHVGLGSMYYQGNGVEKDMAKAVHHWEQAAIGGHPQARAGLATHEMRNNRPDRAAKHFIIAANLGEDLLLKPIKELFVRGAVSKEEYAAALRGCQAAVDATKSAEREEAEKAKIR